MFQPFFDLIHQNVPVSFWDRELFSIGRILVNKINLSSNMIVVVCKSHLEDFSIPVFLQYRCTGQSSIMSEMLESAEILADIFIHWKLNFQTC